MGDFLFLICDNQENGMNSKRDYFYLPVGQKEFSWGLYLTDVGHNIVRPYEQHPAREHPPSYQFQSSKGRILSEYQIILITGGEGYFSSGEIRNQRVTQGDVLMLFPGIWHTYSPSSKIGWEDYWIGLNGSWISAICERCLFQPNRPIIHTSKHKEIQATIAELLDDVRKNGAVNKPDYIVSITKILTLLSEEPAEQEPDFNSGKEGIVHEATRVIWEWSYRTLTVNDVAKSVQVNRRTLERYFRDICGASIHDEIIRCRLVRAELLLKKTHVPIHRIATMVGFSSHQQMCLHFIKYFKCTPAKVRKS